MGRYSTSPFLFDEVKTLTTKSLKECGFLKLNRSKNSDIVWSKNGIEVGRIRVESSVNNTLKLSYNCLGESHKYIVNLTWVKSNLNNAKIWYFICPFTNKRCRKLHLINGKFIHRTALLNGMYSSQIESKSWRRIKKTYGAGLEIDKINSLIYSKNFKKTYRGKPTKRYLIELKKIRFIEDNCGFTKIL